MIAHFRHGVCASCDLDHKQEVNGIAKIIRCYIINKRSVSIRYCTSASEISCNYLLIAEGKCDEFVWKLLGNVTNVLNGSAQAVMHKLVQQVKSVVLYYNTVTECDNKTCFLSQQEIFGRSLSMELYIMRLLMLRPYTTVLDCWPAAKC
jgi:hypothetical protein